MINRLTSAALISGLLVSLALDARADDGQFHSLADGYIYTKPATDLDGKWKEEFGIGAPFYTKGPWLIKWNAGYQHSYPGAFNVAPSWTVGASAVYELAQGPVIPGIYTKTKQNLDGLWQQELGLTALSHIGHVGFVFSAGYVAAYPVKWDVAPAWNVSLSVQLRFK